MPIHPTAIIDPRADLHPIVEVGPYTIIGPHVRVDEGTRIGHHVTIEGPTSIGRDNIIHHYAVLGTESQDMKYRGEETFLDIGDRNIIREFVTINRGTEKGSYTRIGSDNRLLAYVHVAHNCTVGNRVVMSNVASLAGHVVVHDDAILGGLVAVHQFCRLGAHCLVGAGAKVVKDIPPCCMADGVPARLAGINTIGLRRRGWGSHEIRAIRRLYSRLFRREQNLAEALELVLAEEPSSPEERLFLDFIRASRRGIARTRRIDMRRQER